MTTGDRWVFALKIVTTLGCGLMAGLYFTFSNFVMKALGLLPPADGMEAMRSINITILNPGFLLLFMGTAGACVLTIIIALARWHQEPGAAFLLAGSAVYLVGSLVVTGVFNVPMNDALQAAKPDHTEVWTHYLTQWTAWNHVRTFASLAAAVALMIALASRAAPE